MLFLYFFLGEYYDPAVSFPYEGDDTLTDTFIGDFVFKGN